MSNVQHSASGSIPASPSSDCFLARKVFHTFTLWKNGVTKMGQRMAFWALSRLGSAFVAFELSHTFPTTELDYYQLAVRRTTLIGRSFLSFLPSKDCAYGYTKWIFGLLACLLLLLRFDFCTLLYPSFRVEMD
jgi:hypothetical protein